jgi:exopolyphosphatase/guanosine-5'-triphosphate,3'-diphosphate pyrophosphatase
LVVDVRHDGRMERVSRSREALHLAAAATDGHVPKDAAFTALRTARALRKEAERSAPDLVVASATSTLREASNGDHLIDQLESAIRHPIRVLDGNEEAAIAYRGAVMGLQIGDEPVLVADLGGGSLEIAAGRGDVVRTTATFPLGAARLTALHVSNDPPSFKELAAIERAVDGTAGPFFAEIRREGPTRCVVSGGTGRAIARLMAAERASRDINGMVIPTAELHGLARRLNAMDREERRALGISTKRLNVLPTGALVLSCLAESLDVGSLVISEWGLREGLMLEVAEEYGRPLRAS